MLPHKEIQSFSDFEALERQIREALQPHNLDGVLRGLWNTARPEGKPSPFMIAGTALFAMRYCAPSYRRLREVEPLSWQTLFPIVDLVTHFLLADPIGFDESVPRSL